MNDRLMCFIFGHDWEWRRIKNRVFRICTHCERIQRL